MATDLARKMVCDWGMSEKLGPLHFGKREGEVFLGRDFGDAGKEYSEQTAVEIDGEVRKIVTANYERAKKVVVENLDKLKVLAEALLEYETIDGAEIDTIFAGQPAGSEAVRRRCPRAPGRRRRRPPRRPPRPSIFAPPRPCPTRPRARRERARSAVRSEPRVSSQQDRRPWPACIVGVLNCTPDSFSDGGQYASVEAAVAARRAHGRGGRELDRRRRRVDAAGGGAGAGGATSRRG